MAKRTRRPHAAPEHAIASEGLTKSYEGVLALAPLDLTVEAGTVVAVVGHNGSGKSTLLQLVAGLLDPSGGRVDVHGEPAGSLAARGAVAYIGDAPVLYDDLSVWEHLEYLGALHGVDDWEPPARDLVGRLGLDARTEDLPARFSRGLRQKTALAIGLLWPARVVLVDEPFVGLDQDGKRALVELLLERRAEGATIVVATHDLELLEHADRAITLENGLVIADQPAATLPTGR